jgi:hypothetical protein
MGPAGLERPGGWLVEPWQILSRGGHTQGQNKRAIFRRSGDQTLNPSRHAGMTTFLAMDRQSCTFPLSTALATARRQLHSRPGAYSPPPPPPPFPPPSHPSHLILLRLLPFCLPLLLPLLFLPFLIHRALMIIQVPRQRPRLSCRRLLWRRRELWRVQGRLNLPLGHRLVHADPVAREGARARGGHPGWSWRWRLGYASCGAEDGKVCRRPRGAGIQNFQTWTLDLVRAHAHPCPFFSYANPRLGGVLHPRPHFGL